MDRRREKRCPECQGAMVLSEESNYRCRNSLCRFNHKEVKCPRCSEKKITDVDYRDGVYQYTCGECMNRWNTSQKK